MRVLDLTRLLPGPYCSRILADLGAEVIRVEHPVEGDLLRYSPPLKDGENILFSALNRGKKSITLNLKAEKGKKIFIELTKTSDVILEGFRPGVMERLDLAYEKLCQINPRVVYCSLNGYGQKGDYRNRAGHDLNYIGLAGLLDLTGKPNEGPSIPGGQIADIGGALWLTIGVLFAIIERERTGRGQRVEASFLGAGLSFLPFALAQLIGNQPISRGASLLTGGVVCYHVYETKDKQYMTLGALEPKFWREFCNAVGRDDLLEHQYAPAFPGERAFEKLCSLFRSGTRQEWTLLMKEVDACCEPVYTIGEAVESEVVRQLNMLSNHQLLPPLQLSVRPYLHAGPAPSLGQHTKELLVELDYDMEAISELYYNGVV